MLVAEIKDQGTDAAGAHITSVYTKQPPHYAIYRTAERVLVHFADADDEAKQQGAALAPLNPLRGEVNGLIDGWRFSSRGRLKDRAKRYDRRVADALGVALQNDVPSGLAVLTGIKTDIQDERTSWARFQYLIAASVASVAVILIVWAVNFPLFTALKPISPEVSMLWLALAGGTIGAFFSIAIALRTRTVLTDLHWVDNTADAVLRVVIGGIAAGVLVSLVRLQAVNITIGGGTLVGDIADIWLYALVVAIIAGFSERLVPDLLEKSAAVAGAAPSPSSPQTGGTKTPSADGDAAPVSPAADAVHDQKVLEDACLLEDCLCDKAVQPAEATSDAELPPATGGIATPRNNPH
jgi:hypothetical protein